MGWSSTEQSLHACVSFIKKKIKNAFKKVFRLEIIYLQKN